MIKFENTEVVGLEATIRGMHMITVYVDITAPLYWWNVFNTYMVKTSVDSYSTMNKIAEKEFTLDDFSHKHLMDNPISDSFQIASPLDVLYSTIDMLNKCREMYLECPKELAPGKQKDYWWQMIQLLPSSYNQKRTVMMNYEMLANIYEPHKNDELDEWIGFCDWIEILQCSNLITDKEK